ncbi:MAG: hypothetical protein L6R41_007818 [Letrouitia leprolyta]|nr:MAG: hypothetical protein L6R41_007818 [Letrouitia leprolyta]
MILPHAAVLAFLALSPQNKPPISAEPPMLCYDPRYATTAPSIDDCLTVIADVLETGDMYKKMIFSRHPFGIQKPLPSKWESSRKECVVVVDIPEWPSKKQKWLPVAEASMLDIKTAAFELMKKCVVDGDHLGGITTTGRDFNLQVRLEADMPG